MDGLESIEGTCNLSKQVDELHQNISEVKLLKSHDYVICKYNKKIDHKRIISLLYDH